MVSNTKKILCAAVVFIAMADLGLAQRTTATFAGIVQDASGAVLPGAEVQLVNEGTSAAVQRLTTETGEFVFDFVPAGVYTLRIGMQGFKTYESRAIPLGAGQNARRTYSLQVGAVTDSVTVTGETPLVNTLSPEQRFNLETLEVRNLPMVNRNITNILEVAAGLTKGEATANGFGGNRFRMNGLGGSSMSVTANGSDANGYPSAPSLSGYGGYNKIDVMSAESVAEVQVVKGVIPAEYGSAMGGSMSLITKSGTNEWHGSLFHRYEGSVLSARHPILAREPNSVWNQFGGSLGGPIKKNKAFFFFAFEGYRQRTSVAPTPTVPTPRFRDILLSALPSYEMRKTLEYYPLPNQPYDPMDLLARWVGPGDRHNDDDHVDWKFDYLVGGGNLSVAFSGGHPYQLHANLQPLNPQYTDGRSLRGNLSYVIGRGGWTSSSRLGINQNHAKRYEKFWTERDPGKPETVEGGRRVSGISYPGMTGLNREYRAWGFIPSWSLEQQIAWNRGTHSWKFGGILALPGSGTPDFTAGSVSFNSLDDILRNEPQQVGVNTGQPSFTWRMVNVGLFAQDDWRVNRRLVLNLGVRYDRYDNFVAKPWDASIPAGLFNLDGLIDSVNFVWGAPRDANSPYRPDNFNIAPRFGFAYTVDEKGDFVVRGGFGVNFQPLEAQWFETQVARLPNLPLSRTFTRAESVALGLRWPVYNEDMHPFATAARSQPSGRYDPNMKPPYAMNYTLGFQRTLTSSTVLETGFVGTRGVKFVMTRTYNQLDRVTGIRPNPNDIQGGYLDNSAQTNFNSWQTSIKQRMTRGLLFNLHHTWGKALSYNGGDTGHSSLGDSRNSVEDFPNVKLERNLSTGDITHTVIVDWVYEPPTPFANSVIGQKVLGGWQISGIWKAMTGPPLQVTQTGGRPDTLDIKRVVNPACCSYGNLSYLNRAAFGLVEVSRASNRTIRRGDTNATPARGPGIWNLDLSLGKSFAIVEGKNLELKADMLNALNHTQYTGISTNMANINFGEVIDTDTARVIQVQLRLAF